jgi:hypothetical protein
MLRAIFILALLGFSAAASAVEVHSGPASINLPAEPGYCQLNAGDTAEQRLLTYVEQTIGGQKLLALFADCKELDTWHKSSEYYIRSYIRAQVPGGETAGGVDDVKKDCDGMRANGDKQAANQREQVRGVAEKLARTDFQGQQFLGVLEDRPGVCFGALLQKLVMGNGSKQNNIVMFASTAVRGRLFYYFLNTPYEDANSVTTALEKLKAYYGDLVQANP